MDLCLAKLPSGMHHEPLRAPVDTCNASAHAPVRLSNAVRALLACRAYAERSQSASIRAPLTRSDDLGQAITQPTRCLRPALVTLVLM